MNTQRALRFSAIGTAVTALSAFTPILVPLLTAVGASALLPWLNWVLLPLLAFFAGWLLIAIRRRMDEHAQAESRSDEE